MELDVLGVRQVVQRPAPACAHCAWRLHLQRLASLLTTVGLIFIAIWWIWPMVADGVPHAARKWAMMGLAVLCCLPQCVYEVLRPHSFGITAYRDSVDYEFRDADRAREFAALNQDAAWVTVK